MALVVSCADCRRRYDAGALALGTHFRCRCGRVLTVEAVHGHQAAVVRCSACGAPRQQSGLSCAHCGADFTLHERDLHTVCPGCLTRVSARARFCHTCGVPIAVAGHIGEQTRQDCPACGPRAKLHRRSIDPGLDVRECGRCAGLWLENATFEHLMARAQERSATVRGPGTGERRGPGPAAPTPDGPAYRPCVHCGKLMNRQNYARRSNVVIDVCREHGAWFDAHELDRILDWVRSGGLEQARAQELEQLVEERRRRDVDARVDARASPVAVENGHTDLLTAVLNWLG